MHTIEAVLAAILFLFFIVTVTPQAGPDTAGGEEVDRRAVNTLEALDMNDSLRAPATGRDLETIRDRVVDHMAGRSVEISGLFLNVTGGRETFSTAHTDSFPVNDTNVERQVLRVWYEDAVSPNVSVNGNEVAGLTGTVDGYSEYDISGDTSDGTNNLTVTVSSESTVGYTVEIYEREDTGTPPSGTDILTTSYIIGGDNASFNPVEVSVLSWR